MMIRKILIPTDFSEFATTALEYAAFLAKDRAIELHVLHVVELNEGSPYALDYVLPPSEEELRSQEEQATRVFEESLAGLSHEVKHRVLRRSFSAAPAIVEYAEEEGIDLIVMGSHGRRGIRRFLLGSVAEEVVRTAPCSTLTLQSRPEEGSFKLDQILVPFDFSSHSEEALAAARQLATSYGGKRIEVVHVVPILAAPLGPGMPTAGPIHLEVAETARETLGKYEVPGGDGEPQLVSRVLDGPAPWRIVEAADSSGTDLIIVGSRGLSGLRRFLLGSVSERVVRWASCPVLVLRSPAEEVAQAVSA